MKCIKRTVKKFNDLNTKSKLTISYLLVVFMPLILTGVILTTGMRDMALDNAVDEAKANVDRVTQRIQNVMHTPVLISNKFIGSDELTNIIYQEYDSAWDMVRTYLNYHEMDELNMLFDEVNDIKLYVTKKDILENYRFMNVTDEIRNLDWFQKAVQSQGAINWGFIRTPGDVLQREGYTMLRLLKSNSGKEIGVLAVRMNMNTFYNILRQESFETMFFDDKGSIIAAKEASMTGKKIDTLGYLKTGQINGGIQDIIYKNEPCKMLSKVFRIDSYNGEFTVVSIFSLSDITKNARGVSFISYTFISISLALSLVLIILFANALSRRIKLISKDMHEVAQGNFQIHSNIDGKDEVGYLSEDLNKMIDGISTLVHEVYEVNLQKNQIQMRQKEIKLRMLANQINPHFLFNALEAIRMKAHTKGEDEIANIIRLLGKVMRINLKIGDEKISLRREFDLIETYLKIQKFRFDDKIDYKFHISDEAIMEYNILPLLVQPLVENAIVHGLERKEGKGLIQVEVYDEEEKIIVKVTDDGVGITGEEMEMLKNTLYEQDENSSNHVGLRNVYQRIKLYYGKEYDMEIKSKPDSGTTVTVTIPKE